MSAPTREDWPRLIAELEAAGVSRWKLGQMLKPICQLIQVNRWASRELWENGTEPSHWLGQQILAIHSEYVAHVGPGERPEVPVTTMSSRWTAEQRMKERARGAAKMAFYRGRLTARACEKCGAEPAEMHHDDYSKPLHVRWLCRRCHCEWHTENDSRETFG